MNEFVGYLTENCGEDHAKFCQLSLKDEAARAETKRSGLAGARHQPGGLGGSPETSNRVRMAGSDLNVFTSSALTAVEQR